MNGTTGGGAARRRPVTVEQITATALRLIDASGLEALTMRGLADELGVKPVTVYRYLPNKEAILAEVADRLWRELPAVDPAIGGWRERLRAMWQQLFDLMLRHPNAVPLIARGGGYSATAGADTAGMLDVLRQAGFPAELAGRFVHAASALVVGFAFAHLWQRQAQQGGVPAAPAGQAPEPGTELAEFVRGLGPFTTEEFALTLELLLDGFARQVPEAAG